jgi:hypothetical protein
MLPMNFRRSITESPRRRMEIRKILLLPATLNYFGFATVGSDQHRPNGCFAAQRAEAALGRFTPAHCDLAMSGEGSAAAAGRVQFYARTRPVTAFRGLEKQTFVDFA